MDVDNNNIKINKTKRKTPDDGLINEKFKSQHNDEKKADEITFENMEKEYENSTTVSLPWIKEQKCVAKKSISTHIQDVIFIARHSLLNKREDEKQNCYKLKHIARECPKKRKACKYCGLANHEAAKCRNKNNLSKNKCVM
ncbi:hypothetical protein RFI_26739 [Reticulomyxa filosa]|uniref:CCHC-type domain-containing protein n=1 Tax=Reticulomyxa filosa TaxID=46433 RepID=X6M9F8_RETFI|nr:hypothetical protein RFI_26739 [Reticulomyxa filosa]|eukprot:ETO10638.1 hypothetical protein RFI_26739 [Reticulomyxa filosa]